MMINLTALTANSGPSWVWNWLSNLIGDNGALAIQSILMILVYGFAIVISILQLFRIMGAWHDRNDKDVNKREEAKKAIVNGFIIIGVVAVLAGVGFTAIFFFLNNWIKV